ncbi:stigma-specific STIG1-like protein 1 [Andrographis paniculata]|uniref:stigma-specific STIG1-like protein 1 n=1 Tax=Andrographis paniculata TaxID=175694 RepID=UPI0021E8ED89|nr:stigma-specific STIG1-like protein 1 [Andrographis paniculata]
MRDLAIKFILLVAMSMALALSLSADHPSNALPSLQGGGSHFLQQTRRPMTTMCNKYPRICLAKGSPGSDCCRRRYVDVSRDRLNCGKCGNKCRYSETCCGGKCVNLSTNKKHCGGCSNVCSHGSRRCVFGMCSYA